MDDEIEASDAFWMGALTMVAARAIFLVRSGRPDLATSELDHVLRNYAKSNGSDENLLTMIAPWWTPEEDE